LIIFLSECRGEMTEICPKCQAFFSDEFHFCSTCGTSVKSADDPSVLLTKKLKKTTTKTYIVVAGKYCFQPAHAHSEVKAASDIEISFRYS
jgi:predicted amidophosphoribosyltransferase